MTYTKSSLPYLCLLIFFVIIIPLFNFKLKSTQRIVVEVKPEIALPDQKVKVFADLRLFSETVQGQQMTPLLLMSK